MNVHLDPNSRFQSILENIEDGYFEIDIDRNITFHNASFAGILRYFNEELAGFKLEQFFDHQNSHKLNKILNDVLKSKKNVKAVELEMVQKDGSICIIETPISIRFNHDGQTVIGFRGLIRDVTERKNFEQKLFNSYINIKNAKAVTILGLAKLAEYRDDDTGRHLERIREYVKLIAEEVAEQKDYMDYITPEYIDDLYQSSILHDIGKVGVPDAILLKPSKLTPAEFEVIKQHSIIGGDALSAVEEQIDGQSFLTLGKEIAYYHHERWDGNGYPKGLKGSHIPLSARLVALSDVYDALTTRRIYKGPFTHEVAKEIILKERGGHFDPDIIDGFLVYEKRFEEICRQLHEE